MSESKEAKEFRLKMKSVQVGDRVQGVWVSDSSLSPLTQIPFVGVIEQGWIEESTQYYVVVLDSDHRLLFPDSNMRLEKLTVKLGSVHGIL